MEKERIAGHSSAESATSLHNFTGSAQAAPPSLRLTASTPDNDQETKGTVIDGGNIEAYGKLAPLNERIVQKMEWLHQSMFFEYPNLMSQRLTQFVNHATFPNDKHGAASFKNALWAHSMNTLQGKAERFITGLIPDGMLKGVLLESYKALKKVWSPLMDEGGQPRPFKDLKTFLKDQSGQYDNAMQDHMLKAGDWGAGLLELKHLLPRLPHEQQSEIMLKVLKEETEWKAGKGRVQDMEDAYYLFSKTYLSDYSQGTFEGGGLLKQDKPVIHLAYCNALPDLLKSGGLGCKTVAGRRRYHLFPNEAQALREGYNMLPVDRIDAAFFDMPHQDRAKMGDMIQQAMGEGSAIGRVYATGASSILKGLLGGTQGAEIDITRLGVQTRLTLDLYSYLPGGVSQDFGPGGRPIGGNVYGGGNSFQNVYQRLFFRVLRERNPFPKVHSSKLYER